MNHKCWEGWGGRSGCFTTRHQTRSNQLTANYLLWKVTRGLCPAFKIAVVRFKPLGCNYPPTFLRSLVCLAQSSAFKVITLITLLIFLCVGVATDMTAVMEMPSTLAAKQKQTSTTGRVRTRQLSAVFPFFNAQSKRSAFAAPLLISTRCSPV